MIGNGRANINPAHWRGLQLVAAGGLASDPPGLHRARSADGPTPGAPLCHTAQTQRWLESLRSEMLRCRLPHLRSMEPVECLCALRWQTKDGDDDMVRCLTELLTFGMPDWPDGMSVGTAVHRHPPGGRMTVQ
jgi:hypothetical protein